MPGRLRLRSIVVAFLAVGLVAPVQATLPPPALAVGIPPIDLLFLDGSPSTEIGDGIPRTLVSPLDGTLEGNISGYTTEPGAGLSFAIWPIDQDKDGVFWFVDFGVPAGQILTPGHYVATDNPYGATGLAYFKVSGNSRSCAATSAWFDVLEARFDDAGKPTAFAAAFSQTCGGDPLRGEIRYRSSVGVRARDLAPPSDASLPDTLVGEGSVPTAVVMTNTGNLDVHPLEALVSGSFAVIGDTCANTSLTPGSSCEVQVSFVPQTGGAKLGVLTIPDDTVSGGHQIRLTGNGVWPTVTTLVSTVNPNISPTASTELIATVNPAPDRGLVDFYMNDTRIGWTSVKDGKATIDGLSPTSGPNSLKAVFRGEPFYAPSTSNVVIQDTLQRVSASIWASPLSAPSGHPVAFGVEIDTPSPLTGGTISVVDLLTGNVLVTAPAIGPEVFACLQDLEPGTHRLEATFSGHGTGLPDVSTVDVFIGPGTVVPGRPGGEQVPLDAAWCGNLRPVNGSDTIHEPVVDLNVYAAGGDPFRTIRMSNDGTLDGAGLLANGLEYPYGGAVSWSLVNPSTGGVDEDGQVVISWQVENVSRSWSRVFQQTFTLDRQPPAGTVSIEGGADVTSSRSVSLAVPATDGTSAVIEVAISNDGSTWTTRPYAATQTWTLEPGDGSKSVSVKWRDEAGNWSDAVSDTITLISVAADTAVPEASAPTNKFVAGSTVAGGPVVRFAWTGSDVGSGVDHYEFAISSDGHAYATASTALTSPALSRALAAGHTYRARVRAVDRAGNIGAWIQGPTFRLTSYQESSRSIRWTGAWRNGTSKSYWGRRDRYATKAGAKASLTFTGRSLAWIGSVGPTRGWAKVYINGKLVRSINLNSASNGNRRILFATRWSSAVKRTVVIRISGTAGHPRGDIDALIVGS